MANSDEVMLSIGAIDMFTQELEMTLQTSIERVAIFSSVAEKVKASDAGLQEQATMVIIHHKRMIESIDNQIDFWLKLTLTDVEHDAIHYCQTLAQKLHNIQAIFERSYPLPSTHLH
ncbi:MAG: hypothetical protein K2Q14_02115 [Gammaproteobacteria bacterium]|jgi:uncharacterized membrane protein|nr:hypothetical protein [Gammaproteobacteria bacterium]